MDLILPLAVACIAMIIVVRVFATGLGQRSAREVRYVSDPWDEGWLSADEVAERLESSTDDVLRLVAEESIPYFVRRPGEPYDETTYWFRRDEIDAWIIG
jgi:hypothetical protein